MAIEIIDGFKLSTAVPVDSRIVASGSDARSAIPYKYEGLRVFDTYDSIAYVWMNNTWVNENKSSLSVPSNVTPTYTTGSGYRAGQVLKVLNANNQFTNSNILEVEYLDVNNNITSKTVAINHTVVGSINNPFDSQIKLDVNGSVKASSFIGIGSNLTNLDATKITVGKLNATTQLLPGTSNYVLRTNSTGNGVEWVPAASISSGVSIASAATTGSSSLLTHYLTFIEDGLTTASTLKVYRESTQPIGVIPQNGQIVVKDISAPASPPYSFKGDTSTGIFRSGAGIVSISSVGNQRFEVSGSSVRVPSGTDASVLGLRFGGSGTAFNSNIHGFYQNSSTSGTYYTLKTYYKIGIVSNGDEVLRVTSQASFFGGSGGQGSGFVNIYGDANTLNLYGVNHTYIGFYKSGADNTALTPTRGAYLGFESSTNNNFAVKNEVTGNYIKLLGNNVTQIYSVNGIETLANKPNDFGLYTENNATNGLGVAIKNRNGESLRLASRNNNINYITFYDNTITTTPSGYTVAANPDWGQRTAWIGHYTTAGGNNSLNLVHDSTSGKILFRIGGSVKMEIDGTGVSIPNIGTTMKSIYHGWFFCTYNTGGAGITYTDLYSSGMTNAGFSYNSGNATGGNSPHGYIKLNTPAFTDPGKVIVQVTPRYSAGLEQYMIFTSQVNSATDINVYFLTPQSSPGWAINQFAFNISIFEIVQ